MSLEQEIDKKKKEVKQKPYTTAEIRVRDLLTQTINQYRRLVFPELYDIIKAKLLFSGDIRAAHDALGHTHKTAAVYPLISSIFDSFSANLYDSISLPKVSARNANDRDKAEMAQDFCDWAYDVSDAESVKKLIRNEAALIGTSYGIAGWDKRKEVIKYNKNGVTKEHSRNISNPILDFVSFFELFYDLSTTNFKKARWKARRKILSLDEIIKRYSSLGIEFTEKKKSEIQQNKDDVISRFDFTKIYEINNYEHLYLSYNGVIDPVSFLEDNVLMSITDENPYCELIEYWEGDNLVVMINGRIEYDGPSPYPNGDPFGIVVYEEIPGTCRGLGIGHKIMPHQRQASYYFSKIKDAIGQHLDPMYAVMRGAVVGSNGKTPQTISRIPGKVVEIKDPSIPNGGIKPIDFIDFNVVNIAVGQLNEAIARAQETIGTNSYVQGGQGKVERSFGAVNMKVAVTATRLKPINSSISRFDQQMFETRLSLATEYMDDEFAVKVLGESGYEYKTIRPEELITKFDITVDIDAIRDLTKSERSQTLMNMLNAIAPYNMNPISQTPAVAPEEIVRLIADNMDYEGFNPMSAEDRVAYVQEHLNIAQQVQGATGVSPIDGTTTNPEAMQQINTMPQEMAPSGDISFDELQVPAI